MAFFFEVPFAVVLLEAAVSADEVPVADEVEDWFPVVELAVVLIDWSPVVALVVLESDWSPVLVLFSMVRLDRPRRSMLGEKVEVEPVTDASVLALEPVTAELTLVLEPVTDGLLVVFAVEFVDVRLADVAEVLFAEDAGFFTAAVLLVLVPACASGMQSWCTGLLECSFAIPVSLPASLPAWGCPSELQSGLVADAAVEPVADLAEASAASAELAAPNMAATARALMYLERIMWNASSGYLMRPLRAAGIRRGCEEGLVRLAGVRAREPRAPGSDATRPGFPATGENRLPERL